METSGHDLFIKDNAIVDAKEWLLDPDEVSINALALGRTDIPQESSEYTLESASNEPERKKTN
nr:hypothetical protein BV052_01260 [Haemophilus influenzae]